MGDPANGRRTALAAAVSTALRAPRQPTSGLAAIVSTFSTLAQAELVAAFSIRAGEVETLAVAGARAQLVGAPGPVTGPLRGPVSEQAGCDDASTGGQVPPGFEELPVHTWACCPLTHDATLVLLAASGNDLLLDPREILGPIAALAAVASARDEAARVRDELSAVRQEQSMRSAGLQHDLRVPLHTVMAAASTLRDHRARLDEEQRDRMLTMIAEQAKRAADLASGGLSDVSGDAPVRRIRADVGRLVHAAADAVRANRGGDVVVDVPPMEVETDPQRLERAITNLLDNALKHGGAAGAVTVSSEHHDGLLSLTVADRGPGVNDAILPSLFGAFVTDPDEAGGTGVGLHSVRRIAEELGGRVTYSRRDGWTRFCLMLPVEELRRDAVRTEELV